MIRLTATLLSLLLLASPAASAKKRVKFPPGRTTVILKSKTTVSTAEVYVLRARKGQRMTLHLTSTSKKAVFTIFPPDWHPTQDASNVTEWDGELPQTGDYEIWVSPRDESGDTAFTLEVTVR
ncbi:MAG: hypothetical protein M3362_05235 [Acidobacteriota bacterium]|nr:hypothetical protein [Acidobacteriota bacterium]